MEKLNLLDKLLLLCQRIYFSGWEPIVLRFMRRMAPPPNDKVSIIIATYNRSKILIERTIPSCLSQTHKNIEIIVIGDSCIDDTAKKMFEIYGNNKSVRFYDLEKRGKYPQHISQRWFVQGTKPRNFGMKVATGSWFVFISDDDILYPHHIETLMNESLKQSVEFISASYHTIKNGVKITVHPAKNNFKSDLICGGMQTWLYRSYLRCFKWNIHSWRKSVDRPVDYDLQQRMYASGVKMGYCEEVVYFNPPVEGTNTTGYEAALLADNN